MTQSDRMDHETIVNMTRKGQVLIPKAVRDRIGLLPGEPVRVGTNDRGEAVILPARDRKETAEERVERIRHALRALSGKYRTGQSTDGYMRWLRGDWQP